jgi:hypothetical protein
MLPAEAGDARVTAQMTTNTVDKAAITRSMPREAPLGRVRSWCIQLLMYFSCSFEQARP